MLFSKFFKQSVDPGTNSLALQRTEWQDKKFDCITIYDRDFHKFETSRNSANCRKKNFFGLSEEYEMTEYMGGKIEELILRLKGKEFICIGRSDGHHETVGSWFGYEHGSGLPDRKGKKWWIYQKCTKSDYDIAWWKIEQLLQDPDCPRLTDGTGGASPKIHNRTKCEELRIKRFEEYYRILPIDPNATSEDIKKTYRYLVKRFHPDSSEIDKETASEMLKRINEAYEVLSNLSNKSSQD